METNTLIEPVESVVGVTEAAAAEIICMRQKPETPANICGSMSNKAAAPGCNTG